VVGTLPAGKHATVDTGGGGLNDLPVGGSNPNVERIGNTIRRPVRPWSDSVHHLLQYLEQVGYPYSPRLLGIDNDGREILSYINGIVPTVQPWPDLIWRDETLRQVIGVVREYQHAVSDYRPPDDSRWRFATGGCHGSEIVCHNDVGPPNVVFSEAGEVVGLIDWEMAAPARATNDIAHVAWWWVPLVHPALAARIGAQEADVTSRLMMVSDAFGVETADLVRVVREYVKVRLDHAQRGIGEADAAFLALERRGYLDDLAATLEHLSGAS
jgi:Phosphotransferase enzyme family